MVKGMLIFYFEHDSVCRGCALAKNVKKSFSNNSTKSKGILELIHSVLCGPISAPSPSGYLYLMKNKKIQAIVYSDKVIENFHQTFYEPLISSNYIILYISTNNLILGYDILFIKAICINN